MEQDKEIFSWIMYQSTTKLEKYLSAGISPFITLGNGPVQTGLFEFFIENLSNVKNRQFIEDTLEIFKKYNVPMEIENNSSLFNNLIKNDLVDISLFRKLKYLYKNDYGNRILQDLLKNDGFMSNDYNLELQIQKINECGIDLFKKNSTEEKLIIFEDIGIYIKLSLNDILSLEKYNFQIDPQFLENIIKFNTRDKEKIVTYLIQKIPCLDINACDIGQSLLFKFADSIYKKGIWDIFFEKSKRYGTLNDFGFISKIINLKESSDKEKDFKNYLVTQNNISFDDFPNKYIENCFSGITNAYIINQWEIDKFNKIYEDRLCQYIQVFETTLGILDKKNPSYLKQLDITGILEKNLEENKTVPVDYLLNLREILTNLYEKKQLTSSIFNDVLVIDSIKKEKINRI